MTDRTVFFIHVMRTGGTSFREMLWEQYPDQDVYPNAAQFSEPPRHYPELAEAAEWLRTNPAPALVNGHYPYVLRSLLPPSTLVLTLLRDPVDRSISVMRRARRRNARFKSMNYEAIFEDALFRQSHIEDYQTKVFSLADVDELASINLPLRLDRDRLARAVENLNACDVVGVTDQFDSFVSNATAIGIPLADRVHTNRTPASDDEPFSDALLGRISEAVELDFHLYDQARRLSKG